MLAPPSVTFAPNFALRCEILYKLEQFIYINPTEMFKMAQKSFDDQSLSKRTVL